MDLMKLTYLAMIKIKKKKQICGTYKPTPERILYIAQAYREGLNTKEVHSSKIDPWFLEQIKQIVEIENSLIKVMVNQKITMNFFY